MVLYTHSLSLRKEGFLESTRVRFSAWFWVKQSRFAKSVHESLGQVVSDWVRKAYRSVLLLDDGRTGAQEGHFPRDVLFSPGHAIWRQPISPSGRWYTTV